MNKNIIWVAVAVAIILGDVIFLRNDKLFYLIIGIAVIIGFLPFLIVIMFRTKKQKEEEEMFLEFSRNLLESVVAGTPISRGIMQVKDKNYGPLTSYVQKLANQIAVGIPVKKALQIFAQDLNNPVISKAIVLISEAEEAGGEIQNILESVAKSVSETERLKKERRAAISTFVVQGYIIFFIFVVIMLVIEFKILPMTAGMGGVEGFGSGSTLSTEDLSNSFLYLLLVQGFFAGLVIGKLTEGRVINGLKHSFLLTTISFLISNVARIFLG
ncbi:hypothetical protein COV15_01985 [Candidatus Woesearchaeota archaeon CG10_big_fil_rev_8_21_14_0_10_34_12]|nr:MAG: hypothetical protein COV15_01985 [Candidatus Woesearchaeota archaeon CG10_big_fil_rev_8_21_14_0_10_34_12]